MDRNWCGRDERRVNGKPDQSPFTFPNAISRSPWAPWTYCVSGLKVKTSCQVLPASALRKILQRWPLMLMRVPLSEAATFPAGMVLGRARQVLPSLLAREPSGLLRDD